MREQLGMRRGNVDVVAHDGQHIDHEIDERLSSCSMGSVGQADAHA